MSETDKVPFQDSLTHRMVRGGGIVVFFALLSSPIGYLIRMLYSRTLSIEMYGLFYSILSLLIMIGAFNDLGFGYSLSYLVPKLINKGRRSEAWLVYRYNQIVEFGTAILISILLFFSADYLSQSYFKSDHAKTVITILLIFFVAESLLAAIENFFKGLQQEKRFASIGVVKLLLSLGISIIFYRLGKVGVYWYAAAWSISSVLTLTTYNYVLRVKNKKLISSFSWNRPLISRMYGYAIPILMISSLNIVGGALDNLLLIYFKGLGEVGAYNIILPLVVVSTMVLTPLNNILLPLISNIESKKDKIRMVVEVMLKIVPYVSLYFGFFVFLFPESVVQTVFGSKWIQITKSPLRLAALGYMLFPTFSLFSTIGNALGLVKDRMKLSIFNLIGKLVLNGVLIAIYGVLGAIIANIILYLINIVFLDKYIRKKIAFKYPVKFYLYFVVFVLTVKTLVQAFSYSPMGLLPLGATGFIYTALYVGLGYYAEVIDRKSLRLLGANRRFFRKR